MLALTIWFALTLPPTGCGIWIPGDSVLLKFQLARTDADIAAIFGMPDTLCRAEMAATMWRVNAVDLIAYIPAYALFLTAAISALPAQPLRTLAMALVTVGVAADIVETAAQQAIVADISGWSAWSGALTAGSAAKFVMLSLGAAVALYAAAPHVRIGKREVAVAAPILLLAGLSQFLTTNPGQFLAIVMGALFAVAVSRALRSEPDRTSSDG